MLVAFSRQAGSDKQKKELTSILDEYEGELKQKKERHVLLLRYNC
jgi:hypothetical protein